MEVNSKSQAGVGNTHNAGTNSKLIRARPVRNESGAKGRKLGKVKNYAQIRVHHSKHEMTFTGTEFW